MSYSTQALPINVLLDTLIRPNGDTGALEDATNVTWTYQPERAIPHVVIGNTASPGGQWVDNPVPASWDIGTLSYAEMLSLEGYSFAEHYRRTFGKKLPPFTRPSRRQITEYFRSYPHRVRIDDAIHCGETVSGITRTPDGFHIASHGLECKHLVLASGVFSELIPAPPLLRPLLHLPGPSARPSSPDVSLLVIGSGFSAADVITSCAPDQKIIHIYKWAPSTCPSPLRACHQQAYPEYAGIYRRMKQAATRGNDAGTALHSVRRGRGSSSGPKLRGASTSAFDCSRDWESKYEGLPNATIMDVKIEGETAVITLQTATTDVSAPNTILQRRVSRLEYVVGRRGSLRYLSRDLRREVCSNNKRFSDDDCDETEDEESAEMISGHTLRDKVLEDIEVAPNVFAIGSLTGDSLIRFAYGSCTYAAGRLMASWSDLGGRLEQQQVVMNGVVTTKAEPEPVEMDAHEAPLPAMAGAPPAAAADADAAVGTRGIMNGLDGHHGFSGDGGGKPSSSVGDSKAIDFGRAAGQAEGLIDWIRCDG